MAKLTARGCHKVAHIVFDAATDDDRSRGDRVEITFALRSDGAVLRKVSFVRKMQFSGDTYRQDGTYAVSSYRMREANKDKFLAAMTKVVGKHYGDPIRHS